MFSTIPENLEMIQFNRKAAEQGATLFFKELQRIPSQEEFQKVVDDMECSFIVRQFLSSLIKKEGEHFDYLKNKDEYDFVLEKMKWEIKDCKELATCVFNDWEQRKPYSYEGNIGKFEDTLNLVIQKRKEMEKNKVLSFIASHEWLLIFIRTIRWFGYYDQKENIEEIVIKEGLKKIEKSYKGFYKIKAKKNKEMIRTLGIENIQKEIVKNAIVEYYKM